MSFEDEAYLTGWDDALESIRNIYILQVNIPPTTPTHGWRQHKKLLHERIARAKRVAYARSRINTPIYNADII